MSVKTKKVIGYICIECGNKFTSNKGVQETLWHGCPNCGSSYCDLIVERK